MKDTRIKEKNLLTYSSTVNIYMYNYKEDGFRQARKRN